MFNIETKKNIKTFEIVKQPCFLNLTTISTEPKILWEFGLQKLKTVHFIMKIYLYKRSKS